MAGVARLEDRGWLTLGWFPSSQAWTWKNFYNYMVTNVCYKRTLLKKLPFNVCARKITGRGHSVDPIVGHFGPVDPILHRKSTMNLNWRMIGLEENWLWWLGWREATAFTLPYQTGSLRKMVAYIRMLAVLSHASNWHIWARSIPIMPYKLRCR